MEISKELKTSISGVYKQSKIELKDLILKAQIEETLSSNPCYGHRRIAIHLKINRKRI